MTRFLPELLRNVALAHPNKPAVRDPQGVLNYTEFLAAVNRLAQYLLHDGCAKGTWIATCLPRGIDALVAQAAILSIGAIYVPVDPTYPTSVLGAMLRGESPVRFVGYRAAVDACLAAAEGIGIVLDDAETLANIASLPAEPPCVELLPQDGAYVIHTSGSSGTPKGVLVNHAAIANSTLARWERYEQPVTGFLMVSPMFFDSSLAGIWWTLSQGGTLELAPQDPAALLTRLRIALTDFQPGVSHTLLTPTLYSRALDGLTRVDTAFSTVVVAGEMCSEALVLRHYKLLPDVALVNEYGPTEAGVWCSSAVLRAGEKVAIGIPIANTELLVVDHNGACLPIGAVGELAVAGVQLAEGYPHDATLTRQRFVAHPTRTGERMYRTGDRAWQDADGQYFVSGRLDEQVKIRGFRVDLAGVRSRLATHAGVAEVALAMRERAGLMGRVLTAYVVPQVVEGSVVTQMRETWTRVVDEVALGAAAKGTDFDISGWNSSYTGQPLSVDEMEEWVQSTVALLREQAPSKVLDLGCGSGLPLLRVAPQCERYVGLDVSQRTLDNLQLAVKRARLSQVHLQKGEAADVSRFEQQHFDLIVSISVSQYFPHSDYLVQVLAGALAALRAEGRAIIGDVRDLGLLWEFHTAVVLARLAPETPAAAVLKQVAERVDHETQLVISPRWFTRLNGSIQAEEVEVELRPRRGWQRNEMNDFRFDAIVHRAASVTRFPVPQWLDWSADIGNLTALRSLLRVCRQPLGIRRVPNSRTAGVSAVLAHLQADLARENSPLTVFGLRALRQEHEGLSVHPETLFDIAALCGLELYLDRSAAHPAGAFDAVFYPRLTEGTSRGTLLPCLDSPDAYDNPQASNLTERFITDPSTHRVNTAAFTSIVPELRRFADHVLAPQERPGAYVVMSSLPMTRQGKVDTAALPQPQPESLRSGPALNLPETDAQNAVASVWSDLLGVEQIGIDEDFISLGGDSLLAAACAVQLCELLHISLPTGVLFSAPTIRSLARVVEDAESRSQPDAVDLEGLASMSGQPAETGDALPLTSAQTVFWYLDHYRRPGSSKHPDFALAVHYRISGKVDTQAMSDAIDQLVQRHEALRTSVRLDAFEGLQTVLPAVPQLLVRLSAEGSDPDTSLRAAAQNDTRLPLDPALGRVFTAQLSTASDTEHLLILRVHHIVADGRSIDVLESELEELYEAALTRRPHTLRPPPNYRRLVQRIDQQFFVDLNWRTMEPYQSALRYWEQHVRGVEPSSLSPFGESIVPLPTQQQSLDLTGEDFETLLELSRSSGATLFSTVVAALAYLRVEDSGTPDVRLLTLNAARDSPELDRMVGLLLNPMLLRLSVSPADELSEIIARASTGVREALSHGQVPLLAMCEEIPDLMSFMTESQFVGVELLSPARGLSLPHCRVQRTDPFDDDFLGRRFELPVELLLVVRRNGSSVRLTVLYDPAAITREQSGRLLTRLRSVLLARQSQEAHR